MHLTGRDRTVVELVIAGLSNDEIAARIGRSRKTVETTLGRLYRRLETLSRVELAARALREGWLEAPPLPRSEREGVARHPIR